MNGKSKAKIEKKKNDQKVRLVHLYISLFGSSLPYTPQKYYYVNCLDILDTFYPACIPRKRATSSASHLYLPLPPTASLPFKHRRISNT